MTNNKGIVIDPINGRITMTKGFAKLAGFIDTPQYRLFTKTRNENPDYTIEVKNAAKSVNKNTHKGLTVVFMDKVIALQENAADAKAEFKRVKDFYDGHPAYYSKIKAWFLSKYTDYDLYAPAQSEEDTPLENPALALNVDITPLDNAA